MKRVVQTKKRPGLNLDLRVQKYHSFLCSRLGLFTFNIQTEFTPNLLLTVRKEQYSTSPRLWNRSQQYMMCLF